MKKIAVIISHPIQYFSPWFRYLAKNTDISIKVFYLWKAGVSRQRDIGFQQSIQWDIPLLDGYDFEFVSNISSTPGTHHFWGLNNPYLLKSVKQYHPSAVLLIGYNYASIYRFLIRWNHRQIPLLFRGDSHRLIPQTGLKERVKRNIISYIFRCFSAFLYVGEANCEYFCYHQVPPQKLFFAPHAVDNERFFSQTETAALQAKLWKQELGIPLHHKVLLFAGKFEEKKCPIHLLQAFLQADLPNVSLVFVGNGVLQSQLKTLAQTSKNIYFVPFQNQTLMPRTYALADLFVLPSYGHGETWGLAINEAMCMSRPVIVSSHVGCAQNLVQPYQNGLIFQAGDVSALAACIKEAFSDEKRLEEWGKESKRIIENYSYVQTTNGLLRALEYSGILD